MIIYIVLISIMSMLTYVTYSIDKKRSIRNQSRIEETSLYMLSLLFGALGGLLAMHIKRHKTKHMMFHIVNWFCLILHVYFGYLIYIHQLFVF
jgi:uncharacterized membrane protein YsdA (DUF1294 family)